MLINLQNKIIANFGGLNSAVGMSFVVGHFIKKVVWLI